MENPMHFVSKDSSHVFALRAMNYSKQETYIYMFKNKNRNIMLDPKNKISVRKGIFKI